MKKDSITSASNLQAILASATQELAETAAQTKTEAAKGDMQAIRRLAHLQAQQAAQQVESSASAPPPGSTGVVVNVKL